MAKGDGVGAPAKKGKLIKRGSTRNIERSRQVIKDIAKATTDDNLEVEEVSGIVDAICTPSHSRDPSKVASTDLPDDGKSGVSISLKPRKSFLERRFLSQEMFYYPDQTVIIVDWDDTLFPTTWLQQDMGLELDRPLPQHRPDIRVPFEAAMKKAEDFLVLAKKHSNHVIILTLARSPWIENCVRYFAPWFGKVLRNLEIPIVYAREAVFGARDDEYNKRDFETDEEEMAYWTNIKSEAIEQEVARCYSQYEGQSWKNVISIGDSDFEREGTKEMIKRWCKKNAKTAVQLPRTKTLKFLDDPTVDEIADQLKLVISWLPDIIKRDEGLNIDLDNAGNENLGGIESLLTKDKEGDVTGPASALIEGLLWKLGAGGDPMHSDDWIKRRIWLSRGGHLCYESLQAAQYLPYFPGVKASELIVSPAEGNFEMAAKVGGVAIYGIRIQVPPYMTKTPKTSPQSVFSTHHKWVSHTPMQTTFLAAESKQLRDDFIKHLGSFSPGAN